MLVFLASSCGSMKHDKLSSSGDRACLSTMKMHKIVIGAVKKTSNLRLQHASTKAGTATLGIALENSLGSIRSKPAT